MAEAKIESRPETKTYSRRLKWVGIISLIPIVCLCVVAGFLAFREVMASAKLKDKINALRQAGEPVDNESLAKFFESHSHREGTEAWGEILALCRSTNVYPSDLPVIGDGELPRDFRPDCEWPIEPRVAEYLQDAKPILERIYKAESFPKPVWMPIEFRGFYTNLEIAQSSRNISRILYLDGCHALYKKDAARAMKDIQAMRSVSEAFDWDYSLMTKLIASAGLGSQKDIINRSLAMDLWNDEQLKFLSEQMKESDEVSKIWSTVYSGEQAMALAGAEDSGSFDLEFGNSPLHRLLSMPSVQLSLVESYEKIKSIGASGLTGLATRAAAVEKQIYTHGDIFARNLLPATTGTADYFVKREVSRRLSLTAIGIKQFQRKNNRFPKTLSELGDVGLVDRDWSTPEREVLGYETGEDAAFVWSTILNQGKIATSRPFLAEDDTQSAPFTDVVEIR